MIRKIIDMLSGAVILASTIAVIPVSIYNPYGLPFCIWVIAIFLSGLWQLFRYQTDDGPVSYTHLDVYKRQVCSFEGIWSEYICTRFFIF